MGKSKYQGLRHGLRYGDHHALWGKWANIETGNVARETFELDNRWFPSLRRLVSAMEEIAPYEEWQRED